MGGRFQLEYKDDLVRRITYAVLKKRANLYVLPLAPWQLMAEANKARGRVREEEEKNLSIGQLLSFGAVN